MYVNFISSTSNGKSTFWQMTETQDLTTASISGASLIMHDFFLCECTTTVVLSLMMAEKSFAQQILKMKPSIMMYHSFRHFHSSHFWNLASINFAYSWQKKVAMYALYTMCIHLLINNKMMPICECFSSFCVRNLGTQKTDAFANVFLVARTPYK